MTALLSFKGHHEKSEDPEKRHITAPVTQTGGMKKIHKAEKAHMFVPDN